MGIDAGSGTVRVLSGTAITMKSPTMEPWRGAFERRQENDEAID